MSLTSALMSFMNVTAFSGAGADRIEHPRSDACKCARVINGAVELIGKTGERVVFQTTGHSAGMYCMEYLGKGQVYDAWINGVHKRVVGPGMVTFNGKDILLGNAVVPPFHKEDAPAPTAETKALPAPEPAETKGPVVLVASRIKGDLTIGDGGITITPHRKKLKRKLVPADEAKKLKKTNKAKRDRFVLKQAELKRNAHGQA
jgi:hypothetical protein